MPPTPIARERLGADAELTDLTTLGLVAMAKSHVLRAEAPDLDFKTNKPAQKAATKAKSDEVKEIEKEIAQERLALAIAQYRYDAIESQRHLNVARDYLEEAATEGNFTLDPSLDSPVPELTGTTAAEMADYVADEVRPRVNCHEEFHRCQAEGTAHETEPKAVTIPVWEMATSRINMI